MWKKFITGFDNILMSGVTVLITLFLGFIYFVCDDKEFIPLWVIVLTIILCYLVCLIIYAACSCKTTEIKYTLPKVLSIVNNEKLIFIVEKNDIYTYHSLVTIYYKSGEYYEIELGTGYVQTIIEEGLMQIIFYSKTESDNLEILEKLSNTKKDINSIRIRPSITTEKLSGGL